MRKSNGSSKRKHFGPSMTTKPEALPKQLLPAELWQFSLQLYPQVKTLCLAWQTRYRANVNVVLALCFAEQRQWQLTPANLATALNTLAPLNMLVTQQLRATRQQLTGLNLTLQQQQLLKQSILTAELEAERLEQQLLCQTLQFTPAAHSTLEANLKGYFTLLNIEITAQLKAEIVDLHQACLLLPS